MIERYTVERVKRIWNRENRYQRWLDVELAITAVWHRMGQVPDESMEHIRRSAAFSVERIDEIEKVVKHDVIAFLTSVEEHVGPDSAYIHKGVTSYDIVDTALSLLILESLDLILEQSRRLHGVLLDRAREFKGLMGIGRTHGIHAEPISYGIKFLLWYEELERNIRRLEQAREIMAVGKISGSVGTYIHFPPRGEEEALRALGLSPCRVSSQIIQRDRHAEVFYALASLGTLIEKIALEIRHLQRTEVLEMEEPFTQGQKGSSSMPHKRNPVRCERISGLSRLLRSHVGVALENNLLWHERDISHSSAERVIFPDAFHAASFMLEEITDITIHLVIYPENIRRNMELTREVYFSQAVLTLLLNRGIARQKAYELVQANAMKSWTERLGFRDLILHDPAILELCPRQELEAAFSAEPLSSGIQAIFERFENDPV
ncbi:MAG: adenylosuccinate lyase [Acidobacteriota bacterium]|jgi:adenylosuccinate lyase|nr:adenylosuccinate lyase [Acidobacteriota bacterium]